MNKTYANFYIQSNRIVFECVDQINGNYLKNTELNNKVIMPNNVIELNNEFKQLSKHFSNLQNKPIINVIIDDSEIVNIKHNLIKTIITCSENDNFENFNIDSIIDNHIKENLNNQQLVGQKITYEYELYKSNGQVKTYHSCPKIARNEKLIAKTSYFFQESSDDLNKLLWLFNALPSQSINVFLKSQIMSGLIKNEKLVNLSLNLDDNFTAFALVYNGAIINYKQISVGTEILINYVSRMNNETVENAREKIIYVLNNWNNYQIRYDLNLKKIVDVINSYITQLQKQLNNFLIQKYVPSEKLNLVSISGEFEALNNFLQEINFGVNISFNKTQKANESNSLQIKQIKNKTILGAMYFSENFLAKNINPANTISSKYEIDKSKVKRSIFSNLFTFKRYI